MMQVSIKTAMSLCSQQKDTSVDTFKMNLLLINTMMGDFSGDLMLPWKTVEGFPANMFFQPPQ